jgi:hypothetical protein
MYPGCYLKGANTQIIKRWPVLMDQATHDVAAPERARTLHGISYGIRPVGRGEVQAAVGVGHKNL